MELAGSYQMMDRKIISISPRRQITIPQKYFEVLGFSTEAECSIENGSLVIKPLKFESKGQFADLILEDLVSKGYTGQELISKFKEENKKIRPAVLKLIEEADQLAKEPYQGSSTEDIFR